VGASLARRKAVGCAGEKVARAYRPESRRRVARGPSRRSQSTYARGREETVITGIRGLLRWACTRGAHCFFAADGSPLRRRSSSAFWLGSAPYFAFSCERKTAHARQSCPEHRVAEGCRAGAARRARSAGRVEPRCIQRRGTHLCFFGCICHLGCRFQGRMRGTGSVPRVLASLRRSGAAGSLCKETPV
jgi:hypothetical protein